MSSDAREEESEVLKSIFSSDELTITDDFVVEYTLGERGTLNSLIIIVTWPDDYPHTLPNISLDSFYNGHLSEELKKTIIKDLMHVAEEQRGSPSTFIIIEYLRENADRYFGMLSNVAERNTEVITQLEPQEKTKKITKPVQLSKAQKRNHYRKLDVNGELPRGWNWVDVARHLKQTGSCPSAISEK